MIVRRFSLRAFAVVLVLSCVPARADEAPSWFVSEDMCAARDCTCDDVPMMEAFVANQRAARDAWMSVKTDILTPTGPASGPDAVALFRSRFPGDPRVIDQFKSCPGYDAAKNKLEGVGRVSPLGEAKVDPCFCSAFCKSIVSSTIAHERMHVPTIIAGVLSKGDLTIGCGLGLLSGRVCEVLQPLTLADSELLSYDAGIGQLDAAIDQLEASDPEDPTMACTWMPLEDPPAEQARLSPAPEGLFARVTLLLRRIFLGASSEETYAALEVAARSVQLPATW